jgi:hypothetical protein
MTEALAKTVCAISSEPPPGAAPRPRAIERRVEARPRAPGPKINDKRRRAGGSTTDLTIVAGAPPTRNSVVRRRPYQPPIRCRTPSDRKCAGCPVLADSSSSTTCRPPLISTSHRCISVRLLPRIHDAGMTGQASQSRPLSFFRGVKAGVIPWSCAGPCRTTGKREEFTGRPRGVIDPG